MQTKKKSLVESLINTIIGFVVSMALTYWVMPLFGLKQSVSISLQVVGIYTVTSVARNYIVRRIFAK